MKKSTSALALILCLLLGVCAFAGCGNNPSPAHAPAPDPTDDNYRVYYEIFVGSFSDSDGNGVGDLRGIINRLDYLNDGNMYSEDSLGVQGLWLSPIMTSPSYHKYDVKDYYTIDPSFGTTDDLRELVNKCHERNVQVIIDLVLNHTAKSNAWFDKFTKARNRHDVDDQYYDYYTAVTPEERQGSRTFYPIGSSGFYYEGNFSSDMPELNYDNQKVREEAVNIAKYYLDLGVDGFRFDAIKYIYFGEDQKSADFWKWYMDELREIKPDIYCVGECWSSEGEILKYYPALNCFNFTTSQVDGQIAGAVRSENANSYASYIPSFQAKIANTNPDAMYIPFIANHDTDRAAGYLPVDQKQMHMAANLYLLTSGSPFIYYGEEIGMKGTRGSANTDANRRLAMLWGDNDTVKNPSGSSFSDDKQINGTVASQRKDSGSLLNYYRNVIRIRKEYPQIARGTYQAVISDKGQIAFVIDYKGEKTLLVHNVANESVEIDLSEVNVDITALCDYIGQGSVKLSGKTLTIGAKTTAILK